MDEKVGKRTSVNGKGYAIAHRTTIISKKCGQYIKLLCTCVPHNSITQIHHSMIAPTPQREIMVSGGEDWRLMMKEGSNRRVGSGDFIFWFITIQGRS
jgi:hypothetical protein